MLLFCRWLLASIEVGRLLLPPPKEYFLAMSRTTEETFKTDFDKYRGGGMLTVDRVKMDRYGDAYFTTTHSRGRQEMEELLMRAGSGENVLHTF